MLPRTDIVTVCYFVFLFITCLSFLCKGTRRKRSPNFSCQTCLNLPTPLNFQHFPHSFQQAFPEETGWFQNVKFVTFHLPFDTAAHKIWMARRREPQEVGHSPPRRRGSGRVLPQSGPGAPQQLHDLIRKKHQEHGQDNAHQDQRREKPAGDRIGTK